MSLKFNLNEIYNNELMTFKLPKDIADGKIEQFTIEDGLILEKFDITPKQNLILEHTVENEPLLSCSAFLEGGINYYNKQFKFDNHFKKDSLSFCAVNCEDGLSHYKKETRVKAFHLVITPLFIKKILINESKDTQLDEIIDKLHCKPMFEIIINNIFDHETINGLRNIDNIPFDSNLKKIYIQSKVYDLVYKCLYKINANDTQQIKEEDKYYLEKVKEFILQNLNKAFSLIELSKIASTNENKLQKMFKIYFKQTVFEYILDCRMFYAKELLQSSDYNINEISQKIGYKHQSNFTIAFTKKFGILPKDIRKNRKYYYF